jgi:hypothetical protein
MLLLTPVLLAIVIQHGISPLIRAKERSAGLKPLISGFKRPPASRAVSSIGACPVKKDRLSTIPQPQDQRSGLRRKEEMEGINQCRFPADRAVRVSFVAATLRAT